MNNYFNKLNDKLFSALNNDEIPESGDECELCGYVAGSNRLVS